MSARSATAHVAVVMICSQPIVKPPTLIASLKISGIGTPFWRGEIVARKMFWMITASAKLANRSVRKLAPRSGRKATRSMSTAETAAAAIAAGTCPANGTPLRLSRYMV